MTENVTRESVPDGTVELIELLAERLDMTAGRQWFRFETKSGRFDFGRLERYITRSNLAAQDAERTS